VITNRCADACTETFDLPSRDEARRWLLDLVAEHGVLTSDLPAPLTGRRSPSGQFVLVDGVLALPLAEDRDGEQKWIATNCLAVPGARPGHRIDPLGLRGKELLAQITVLTHAVERFQQRCGGHPDPARARQELVARLAPTAHARSRPPEWCGTRQADFYLVAGAHDEYCLPCRPGSGARPFDATTCIHEASELFELSPRRLLTRCRFDTHALPAGSRNRRLLTETLANSGHLTWHRPRWAGRRARSVDWWIVSDRRIAAPVSWHPDDPTHPLLLLGLTDRRPLLRRLFARLRSG
jgi:hypothetical protein